MITSPIANRSDGTGCTISSVPGGRRGSIELLSTAYGVAPAARGTAMVASTTAARTSSTSQPTTEPTQEPRPPRPVHAMGGHVDTAAKVNVMTVLLPCAADGAPLSSVTRRQSASDAPTASGRAGVVEAPRRGPVYSPVTGPAGSAAPTPVGQLVAAATCCTRSRSAAGIPVGSLAVVVASR